MISMYLTLLDLQSLGLYSLVYYHSMFGMTTYILLLDSISKLNWYNIKKAK